MLEAARLLLLPTFDGMLMKERQAPRPFRCMRLLAVTNPYIHPKWVILEMKDRVAILMEARYISYPEPQLSEAPGLRCSMTRINCCSLFRSFHHAGQTPHSGLVG